MPSYAKFDKWANTAGVSYGNIINVVSNIDNTIITTGNASEGDLVSVGITPAFANSKILLFGSFSAGIGVDPASPNITMHFSRIVGSTAPGITSIGGRGGAVFYPGYFKESARIGGVAGVEGQGYSDGTIENFFNVSGHFLDSPNTTQSLIYTLRYATYDGGMTIGRTKSNIDASYESRTYHTIIAMEIAQ
jgi:hypothetical protein